MYGLFSNDNVLVKTECSPIYLVKDLYDDPNTRRTHLMSFIEDVVEGDLRDHGSKTLTVIERMESDGVEGYNAHIRVCISEQFDRIIERMGSTKTDMGFIIRELPETGFYIGDEYIGCTPDDVISAWEREYTEEVDSAVRASIENEKGGYECLLDRILVDGEVSAQDLIREAMENLANTNAWRIGDTDTMGDVTFKVGYDSKGVRIELKMYIDTLYNVFMTSDVEGKKEFMMETAHSLHRMIPFENHYIYQHPEWVIETLGDHVTEAWRQVFLLEVERYRKNWEEAEEECRRYKEECRRLLDTDADSE